MKYLLVAVAVMFVTVYGFKLTLPLSRGALVISSGYIVEEERF